MRVLAFALLFAFVPMASHAKSDAPNVRQLAADHPWHPLEVSTTAIDISCGKERGKYELRVDDRGWRYLIGPKLEAVAAPFGRFVKTGETWSAIELKAWMTPRIQGLSLRELIGEPLVGDDWQVKSAKAEGDTVEASLLDGALQPRTMSFDPIVKVWMVIDGFKVLETQRFGARTLPKKVTYGEGCVMIRAIRAGKGLMPAREELIRE
jgi:hypothetical protein